MLNFFMDESGQDAKKAPLVVVGGFSIAEKKVAPFEEAVKSLYLHCFGINYDGQYELKGTDLLSNHKFENAYKRPLMKDELRQHHCQIFMQGQPQITPKVNEFVAKAQAGILFVESLADILVENKCLIFACMTSKEIFKKQQKEGKSISNILGKMERHLYHYSVKGPFNYYVDRTDYDADLAREMIFTKAVMNHKSLKANYKIHFLNSKENIMIQTADIILYCVNWGLNNFQSDQKITKTQRQDISELKITKFLHPSNISETRLKSRFYWYDGVDIRKIIPK
jgi:hypothetical protein